MSDTLELFALEGELAVEELPEGNALSTLSSAGTASSFACPLTSAGTASSISCLG